MQVVGATTAATALGPGVVAGADSYTTTDLTVDAYDGTTLAATLYEPDEDGPHPAMLLTHGWGMDRTAGMVTRKAEVYAANGYVVLTYDSRGFGDSEGKIGLDGPNEVDDVSRLLDWLAARDDVRTDADGDPVVGMDGGSYAGGIQFVAAVADDRIDAIAPRMTWNDLNQSLAPNGVVKSGWQTLLNGLGQVSAWEFGDASVYSVPLWEWYAESMATGEVPQDAQDAFRERSVSDRLDQLDVPTLLFQGWEDTLFPTTEALRTYRGLQDRDVETRLVLYSGGHAVQDAFMSDSDRRYMNRLALAWMDRHLKGADTDVPQVTAYLKQADTWREGEQFPPADVEPTPVELSETASGDTTYLEKSGWWWKDTYETYDWRVGSDLEVVGAPEFDVWVYPKGPEQHLFFELWHERDGYWHQVNGVGEAYRVEGAEEWHNITFQFPAIQRYFSEGDTFRLRVSVSSPVYLDAKDADGVYIAHDDERSSQFTLPYREQTGDSTLELDLEARDRVHTAVHEVPIYAEPNADHITDKNIYASGHVIDGPETADGSRWWHVRWWEDDEGTDGWVREDLINPGADNSERLAVGDRVEVDWYVSSLPIREGAGTGHTELDSASAYDTGRIVDGPEWNHDDEDTYVWWKIEWDENETGWSAQDYYGLE